MVKLKSSLRKFYGRHHGLVDRYGISVSQMIADMFLIPLPFPDCDIPNQTKNVVYTCTRNMTGITCGAEYAYTFGH